VQPNSLDRVTVSTSIPPAGDFALSISVSPDHPRARVAADVSAAMATMSPTPEGVSSVQVWVEEADDSDTEVLAPLGLTPYRDLLQLRRPLPAPASGLVTRSFVPGEDEDAFIEVNNRAFQWHPEQAGLTRERLAQTMAEDWFDPDGFRLYETEGRLAGFCWTKVHSDHDPVMGEIYVIGVDPDFHGRGLGGPMTLAGLEHLSAEGITLANLYVEADNVPALRVYDKLGFERHSVNRAFRSD
jgi:mycothiol synthase